MVKLEVYDPPMCCSSGVCGPNVDQALPRFASDLEWLRSRGVAIARYNLAQTPEAFTENEIVKAALRDDEENCLPLILVDGRIASRGTYPNRKELASMCGLAEQSQQGIYSAAVAELVAIGAAIACNCEPCFKYHYTAARKLGVSKEDVASAVATAKAVKETPAEAILKLADKYLGTAAPDEASSRTCGDSTSTESSGKCCC
jgi:AhpD family alkylhydroperoxidase